MSWRRKEPGHHQPWYWHSSTEITRSPHVKGYDAHYIWFSQEKWSKMNVYTIWFSLSGPQYWPLTAFTFLFLGPKFSLKYCVASDICRRLFSDDIWEKSILLLRDTVYCYVNIFLTDLNKWYHHLQLIFRNVSSNDISTLWTSDATWRLRSESTVLLVMACCLTTPSHYLNQFWLIISKAQLHSYKENCTWDTSVIKH